MNVSQVYQQYRIMPTLQLHQLRVAAIAQQIGAHYPFEVKQKIDFDNVIIACLLHDMGNILKFDLRNPRYPHFLEPQGQKYWLQVQQSFRQSYGEDEHQASVCIAKEVGVSDRVVELINSIGFDSIEATYLSKDRAKQICEYSDDRVAPWGVVALKTRLDDLEERYKHHFPTPRDQRKRDQFRSYLIEMEKELFIDSSLKPCDITEDSIQLQIEELRSFPM